MRASARWSVVLTLGLASMPAIAPAATQEQIGSWLVSCPGHSPRSEPCVMRSNKRFLDQGGITIALEVRAQRGILVPVIVLRGLSSEMLTAASQVGTIETWIQFPGGAREKLNCAASAEGYICAPNEAGGSKLAAELPAARAVTARVAVTVAGMPPLPAREKSLHLSGTDEALARLRAVGPAQVPDPTASQASLTPSGLMGMADKALRAAGYPNGVTQLQALLETYMKK
jgi:hypothetical protein